MRSKNRTKDAILKELSLCKSRLAQIEVLGKDRQQTQEALKKSEKMYRELVESANSIILRMNINGHITFFNRFAQDFFGFTEEEILGRHAVGTIVPDRDSSGGNLAAMLKDVCTNPEKYMRHENENIRRNGERVWVEWNNKSISDDKGRPIEILGIGCDITQRKRAEEKLLVYQQRLRSLASKLSLTEERERRRLAVQLHDTIGQILAICKLKVQTLRQEADEIPLSRALDEIKGLVEQAIQETRMLTFDLSPPVLYELGFEAAVEWLLTRFRERHGILADFEKDGNPKPLEEDTRIVLFQAVRELLLNVIKHAKTERVRVSVRRRENLVEVIVKDFGVGFNKSSMHVLGSKNRGFGLFSIHERLGHLGGQVIIESQLGKGTGVTLLAPLKNT